MADMKPLVVTAAGQTQQIQTGDTVPLANGGTGATTASAARTALGVAIGVDVLAYSLDATNLHALNTTTGIPARTGTNTWSMRTLTGSTRIGVTNGTGVSGNPTIDLNAYSDGGGGTFLKFTRDANGLISGTTAVLLADISTLISGTYAPIANPTFTGTVTLAADPVSALQAATKQYVDAYAAGQRIKDAVRVASTANVVIASALENGDTIDGVVLATGNRVLLKDQSTGAENGVYVVVASGAASRATDFDSASGEVMGGSTFWVNEGTANADTGWTLTTNDPIVVGTTALTFTQSSGLGQVTAGTGLSKSGNTLNVGTAAVGRIVVNADDIDLASGIVTPGTYTKITVDTYGRATVGATAVPSDIGAQPVDTGLTNIAALTGTGVMCSTATDTYALRTMTSTTGTISITNPAGVAGNINFEQTSGIVTPGTYSGVTVDTYGRVTAGTAGASASLLTDSFTNANAGTIVICRAVYATTTTDRVDLAIANSATAAQVIGLVSATSITTLAAGNIAFAGVMSATTGQWDVVTGQTGGLTPGSMYFLSNTTAGSFTTTAPITGYVVAVGRALSTTKMALRFDPSIQL